MTGRAWAALAAATTLVVMLVLPAGAEHSQHRAAADHGETRRLWKEARDAARSDPAASLAKFDQAIASASGNNMLLLSGILVALRAHDRERLARWVAAFAAHGGALDDEVLKAIAVELGTLADPAAMQRLAAARNAMGSGEVVASIPAETRLVEGVAYDGARDALYVSSVVDRRVERIDGKGRRRSVLELPADQGAPLGLALDAGRGVLWIAVDGSPFEGGIGAGGLVRFSPGSSASTHIRAPSVEPLHIGDVAVGPDGTAYAADSQSGAIYRCAPGCRTLSVLVAPGRLRSAQGMAVAPDGRRLWVSDYSYGLLSVDLRTGATTRVTAAPGIAIDGIDGMTLRNGRVIAVQNGWAPARVIEIEFDAAGIAVAARVIARGGAMAEEPTQIARAGKDALLLVSNSQWAPYGRGMDAGRTAQRPTRVTRIAASSRGRP
jgi:sugar lactone lactonase YvrE